MIIGVLAFLGLYFKIIYLTLKVHKSSTVTF